MARIIVMAKNEVGVMADISRALADNGINIETINAEAIGDNGAISLTTDHRRLRWGAASAHQRGLQDGHGRLTDSQPAR